MQQQSPYMQSNSRIENPFIDQQNNAQGSQESMPRNMFSVKMSKSNGEIIDNMDPNCRRDMEDRYQEQSPDKYLAEDYILSTEKRPRGTESRSA